MHTQAKWLSPSTTARFAHSECTESRTWAQISQTMRTKSHAFRSGSLGARRVEDFQVWACFSDHSCLTKVPHGPTDAMCYVYRESESKWYPWALSSEVVDTCGK